MEQQAAFAAFQMKHFDICNLKIQREFGMLSREEVESRIKAILDK
jgi:hypothetical protein